MTMFLFFSLITLSAQNKLELYFDFNQDVMNKKSNVEFKNWLEKAHALTVLKIEGYCDSIATNRYNINLSSRRVNNVLELLKINAVNIADTITLNALGENFIQLKKPSANRKVIVYYQFTKNKIEKAGNLITLPERTIQQETDKSTQPYNKTLLQQLDTAKVGDLIQLQNLNFYFNSEKIMTESEPVLSALLNALNRNSQLKISIYGHICCNLNPNDLKLSYRRSKFIFDYLIRNGIATARLGYKGFGSSKPLYSLPERNEAERIANRRVEILVIQK